MTAYATADDLNAWRDFYGLDAPGDAERLLALATRDVQRHLGAEWDPALLLPDQADALRDATAVQACFRCAQGADAMLGADDGLASIGPLSFSVRALPRFSPEAAEILSGHALYLRSGTVEPEDDGGAPL